MSRTLAVSRSGYYDWLRREPSVRAQRDERLKVAIKAAHVKSRQTYGSRRLQPELAAEGFVAGRDQIERLRRACPLLPGHLIGPSCLEPDILAATLGVRVIKIMTNPSSALTMSMRCSFPSMYRNSKAPATGLLLSGGKGASAKLQPLYECRVFAVPGRAVQFLQESAYHLGCKSGR
jgi:hypothetical protein